MRGKVGATAIVAVLVLGVASCGGSGTLSQAELVKRADAICQQRQTSAAAIGKRNLRPQAAFAAYIPLADKAISQLAALKPPKELAATYGQFIAGERGQVAQIKRTVAALSAGRRPAPGDSDSSAERTAAAVGKLQLRVCR